MDSDGLDGIIFKVEIAAEEGRKNPAYYKTLTWQQRLEVANYLNSLHYHYPLNKPPKLDRTYFRAYNKEEQDQLESKI
jgi:hypothetical protein